MEILIAHKDAVLEVEYTSSIPGYIKLYSVPTTYSEDGYYVSVWNDLELEPIPACFGKDAILLCHARIENGEVTMLVSEDGAYCDA